MSSIFRGARLRASPTQIVCVSECSVLYSSAQRNTIYAFDVDVQATDAGTTYTAKNDGGGGEEVV